MAKYGTTVALRRTASRLSNPTPDLTEGEAQAEARRYDSSAPAGESLARETILSNKRQGSMDMARLEMSGITRGKDYENAAFMAERGATKGERSTFEKLVEPVGLIDRLGMLVRYGVADLFQGDQKAGTEIEAGDYLSVLRGHSSTLKRKLGTKLVGEHGRLGGSQLLNLLGWEGADELARRGEKASWGNKILRGLADFTLEAGLDPLTYATMGASALSKTALLKLGKSQIDNAARFMSKGLVKELPKEVAESSLSRELHKRAIPKYEALLAANADEIAEKAAQESYYWAKAVEGAVDDVFLEVGSPLARKKFAELPAFYSGDVGVREAGRRSLGGLRLADPLAIKQSLPLPGTVGLLGKTKSSAYDAMDRFAQKVGAEGGLDKVARGWNELVSAMNKNHGVTRAFKDGNPDAAKLFKLADLERTVANRAGQQAVMRRTVNSANSFWGQAQKEVGAEGVAKMHRAFWNAREAANPLAFLEGAGLSDEAVALGVKFADDWQAGLDAGYQALKAMDPDVGDLRNYWPIVLGQRTAPLMDAMLDAGFGVPLAERAAAAEAGEVTERGLQLLDALLSGRSQKAGRSTSRALGESGHVAERSLGVETRLKPEYTMGDVTLMNFGEVVEEGLPSLGELNEELTQALVWAVNHYNKTAKGRKIALPKTFAEGADAVLDADPTSVLVKYQTAVFAAANERKLAEKMKDMGLLRRQTMRADAERLATAIAKKHRKIQAAEDVVAKRIAKMEEAHSLSALRSAEDVPLRDADRVTVKAGSVEIVMPKEVADHPLVQKAVEAAKVRHKAEMRARRGYEARVREAVDRLKARGVSEEVAESLATATTSREVRAVYRAAEKELRRKVKEDAVIAAEVAEGLLEAGDREAAGAAVAALKEHQREAGRLRREADRLRAKVDQLTSNRVRSMRKRGTPVTFKTVEDRKVLSEALRGVLSDRIGHLAAQYGDDIPALLRASESILAGDFGAARQALQEIEELTAATIGDEVERAVMGKARHLVEELTDESLTTDQAVRRLTELASQGDPAALAVTARLQEYDRWLTNAYKDVLNIQTNSQFEKVTWLLAKIEEGRGLSNIHPDLKAVLSDYMREAGLTGGGRRLEFRKGAPLGFQVRDTTIREVATMRETRKAVRRAGFGSIDEARQALIAGGNKAADALDDKVKRTLIEGIPDNDLLAIDRVDDALAAAIDLTLVREGEAAKLGGKIALREEVGEVLETVQRVMARENVSQADWDRTAVLLSDTVRRVRQAGASAEATLAMDNLLHLFNEQRFLRKEAGLIDHDLVVWRRAAVEAATDPDTILDNFKTLQKQILDARLAEETSTYQQSLLMLDNMAETLRTLLRINDSGDFERYLSADEVANLDKWFKDAAKVWDTQFSKDPDLNLFKEVWEEAWVPTFETPGYVPAAAFRLGGEVYESTMGDVYALKFMEDATQKLVSMAMPEVFLPMMKRTRAIVGWWKGMATVARIPFHERNFISATWHNFVLGGVSMNDYAAAGHLFRGRGQGPSFFTDIILGAGDPEAAIGRLPAKLQPVVRAALEEGIFFDTFAAQEVLTRQATTRFQRLNPLGTHGPLVQTGGKVMQATEAYHRFALFTRHFNPAIPESATWARQMVNDIHFDYTNLTRLEEGLRTFFPFFVWARNNIPLQLRLLVERPDVISKYAHIMYALDDNLGSTAYDDMEPNRYRQGDLFANTDIVFDGDTDFWSRLIVDPDLPIEDLADIDINPMTWVAFLLESLGPQFDLLQQFGKESDYSVNAPAGFNTILNVAARAGLPGVQESETNTPRVDPKLASILRMAMPILPEYVGPFAERDPARRQKLAQGGQLDSLGFADRLGGFALRNLGGFGLRVEGSEDIYRTAISSSIEQQDAITELRKSGQITPETDAAVKALFDRQKEGR